MKKLLRMVRAKENKRYGISMATLLHYAASTMFPSFHAARFLQARIVISICSRIVGKILFDVAFVRRRRQIAASSRALLTLNAIGF